MTSFVPIPTTRSSDLLVQQRLLTQLRSDQNDLVRLQTQVSTGRRISIPSEDAPSALRALGLQRLLEQKEQSKANVQSSRTFLAATETAVSGVSDLLNEIKATSLTAVETVTSENQRQALTQEIAGAIQQLIDVGNRQFRGRYLFAGSETGRLPFEQVDGRVLYHGNERSVESLADLGLLVESNLTGSEVFGALSPEIQGTVDLNPVLRSDTRLTNLRGGQGIREGSFTISDGNSISTIDISGAETLGDVVRRIEANPPSGRKVTARVVEDHLVLQLEDGLSGNLTVQEIGGGTVARELGILAPSGVGTAPLIGEDLNPRLTGTTRLDDLFGVRAHGRLVSPGGSNDLVIEAASRGAQFNGLTVQLVDDSLLQADSGLTAGSETASFSEDPVAARASLALPGNEDDLIFTAVQAGSQLNNVSIELSHQAGLGNAANVGFTPGVDGGGTLSIQVEEGVTTLQTLIDAVAAQGLFTVTEDTSAGESLNAGAAIAPLGGLTIQGHTGNSGGDANTVFVNIEAGQTTAAQVAAAINEDAAVSAVVSATIDQKEITSAASAGSGTVDVGSSAVLSGGSGVEFDSQSGLQVQLGDETLSIDVSSAQTVEQLLNIINGASPALLAEINADGTGINLRTRASGVDFSVGENGGQTATHLGLRTFTAQTQLSDLNYGLGVHHAEGADFTITRNDGVSFDVDVSAAKTIGDVLDLINNHPDNTAAGGPVVAQLKTVGNGIELIDDNPVGQGRLTVTPSVGNQAASDLGLIPPGGESGTASGADLPQPATAAVSFAPPDDTNTALRITANQPGTGLNDVKIVFQDSPGIDPPTADYDAASGRLTIDIDAGVTTAAQIATAINEEGTFSAAPDTSVDPTNDGSAAVTATGTVATTAGGTAEVLSGRDVAPLETHGIFNSLLRLNQAVIDNDEVQISRAAEALDADIARLSFSRADLGARQRTLDSVEFRIEQENVELQASISEEIDVDLVEAISNLTARQASLEASLGTMARTFQLSLVDFL